MRHALLSFNAATLYEMRCVCTGPALYQVRLFERRLGFFIFIGRELLSRPPTLTLALPSSRGAWLLGSCDCELPSAPVSTAAVSSPVLPKDIAVSDTTGSLHVAVRSLQSSTNSSLGDGGGPCDGLADLPVVCPRLVVSGWSNMNSA